MRTIHNETVSFRCPNQLKERLQTYGEVNDLHLSQVIRRACAELVKQEPPVAIQQRRWISGHEKGRCKPSGP